MKRKKLLFMIGAIVVLVALGIGAAALWLIPPSPRKVCEKVRELTKVEMTDTFDNEEEAAAFVDEAVPLDECVEGEMRHREAIGLQAANKESRCVMKAETYEEMEKCAE